MQWTYSEVKLVPAAKPIIKFKRLHESAVLPAYKTSGAAGADLHSVEEVLLRPGEVRAVSVGFAVSIPEGFEIQLRPRSGLALNQGVTVHNSPGTVDSDYRGEVKVILANFGKADFKVSPGDRIAQAVVAVVAQAVYEETEELDNTARGSGGFGSTGRN